MKDRDHLKVPTPTNILEGLALLGEKIRKKTRTYNPCENNGACFKNEVFSMNAYNWLSIDMPTENFSYNFKYNDFYVSWYKYLGRSTFQNKSISLDDWAEILSICLKSLDS